MNELLVGVEKRQVGENAAIGAAAVSGFKLKMSVLSVFLKMFTQKVELLFTKSKFVNATKILRII